MFVELAKGWKERGEKGEQMRVEILFQGQELEVPNGRFAKWVYCSLISSQGVSCVVEESDPINTEINTPSLKNFPIR